MMRPAPDGATVPPAVAEEMRRSRRHARVTQFDYLHVKRLVDDLAEAISCLPGAPRDAPDMRRSAAASSTAAGDADESPAERARCPIERGS
jgi:hypothetical protein